MDEGEWEDADEGVYASQPGSQSFVFTDRRNGQGGREEGCASGAVGEWAEEDELVRAHSADGDAVDAERPFDAGIHLLCHLSHDSSPSCSSPCGGKGTVVSGECSRGLRAGAGARQRWRRRRVGRMGRVSGARGWL